MRSRYAKLYPSKNLPLEEIPSSSLAATRLVASFKVRFFSETIVFKFKKSTENVEELRSGTRLVPFNEFDGIYSGQPTDKYKSSVY